MNRNQLWIELLRYTIKQLDNLIEEFEFPAGILLYPDSIQHCLIRWCERQGQYDHLVARVQENLAPDWP